jgi:hypothetical protein
VSFLTPVFRLLFVLNFRENDYAREKIGGRLPFFPSTKKKNLSLSSSSSSFRRRNSHAIVQYAEVVKQQQQTLRL